MTLKVIGEAIETKNVSGARSLIGSAVIIGRDMMVRGSLSVMSVGWFDRKRFKNFCSKDKP